MVDAAVARAERRLLPLLLLMYVIAFLDRANIGFAKQALQASAGISAATYALGAGLFFLSYALLEVPSNMLLRRLGARAWLARIMVSWGVVSTATLLVRGPASFYALRLLLGAAEAGFFPGVLLYLSYWFPGSHRGRILGVFYFGAPLALIFGGPVSGALLAIPSGYGLQGWQWMFALEGLLAVAVGALVYAVLPDRPQEAHWLSAAQKAGLTALLRDEEEQKRAHGVTTLSVLLRDRAMLRYAIIYGLIQVSVYGVVFFLPSEVSAILGRKIGMEVGLVSAVPWVCALAATWWLPRVADRWRTHRALGAATLLAAAAASLLFVSGRPVPAMLGLCVAASGYIAVQPLFWVLPMSYLGDDAAAAGFALINAVGAAGSFMAPNAKVWADTHFGSQYAGLVLLACCAAVAGALLLPAPRRRADHRHLEAGRNLS